MGDIEDRQELMDIARAMITLGHELRDELKGFTLRGDKVINKLIETADRMLPAVMNEKEEQRGVRKKKDVVYVGPDENIRPETVLHPGDNIAKLRRTCSICHQPGHRKTTCPQANKKYKEDRGKGKRK